jgi:tetratricopeptide (TPR) repeat protein
MPWALEPGTDLVLELHLLPGESPVQVQPTVGLFFDDGPPEDVPLFLKLGSKAIDIPAGARDYAIEDSFVLPVDVDLLSVYPHAHYLGKEMQVRATLPDGRTQSLLHIPRWSFHWQQDYRYTRPVPLPRGTRVWMRFTYDNSADNEDNPHDPPRHVMAGQRSTDEMGNLGLQVLPSSRSDRLVLARASAEHDALANLAAAQMLARHNPENAQNQAFLGASYVSVGRIAEAMPHLEHALRLDPRSANAHNEMAGALLAQGRLADAVAHYREAATLAPENERWQFNYGKALIAAGQPEAGARTLERAIALAPEYADAHNELGVLLVSGNRLQEGLLHLRRAAELAPESVYAQSDLGGALARAGQFEEALVYTRRALALDPDYTPARENLTRLERRLAR